MRTKEFARINLLAFAVSFSLTCLAQSATGPQPFGTFNGGPIDSINVGNLNVHIAIPVTQKNGRGIPFSYVLSYDSTVWIPTGAAGAESWQPTLNWGWRGQTEVAVGYLTYSSFHARCPGTKISEGLFYYTWGGFAYHDSFGVVHRFNGTAVDRSECPNGYTTSVNTTATDGSGYQFSYDASSWTSKLIAVDGKVINPPVNVNTGSGSAIDTNGNKITTTGTSFTDTLGATALTISGTAPSPVSFNYTAPSGAASVTINYTTSYGIKTNFGCTDSNGALIAEYTSSGTVPLVSSITMPDNSTYQITWEDTPGYSGYKTGRLHSIQLPTGGVYTYNYTGTHNGIVCSDGSAAGLQRTTPDSATNWQYNRTQLSTTPNRWQTSLTDPLNNASTYIFEVSGNNYYEEQRSVAGYQTIDTCYNAATPDGNGTCTTSGTALTIPITQVDQYLRLPDKSGVTSLTTTKFSSAFGLVTETDEYDFGTNGSGSAGALLRKTSVGYAALGNSIVNRPSYVNVYDGYGSPVAQTTYGYDETTATPTSGVPNHDPISGSRGNITSIHQCVNETTCSNTLTSTLTYNDTGDILSIKDPGNHETDIDYTDSYNDGINHGTLGFPTTITYPNTGVAHVEKLQYYWPAGAIYKSTDQNNQTITNSYDNMYRTTQVQYPDGGESDTTYVSPTEIDTKQKVTDTPTWVTSTTLLDSIGRLSQNQQTSNPLGTIKTDTTYDALGRTHCVSSPYLTTADTTYGTTCYDYDPLDRVVKVTNPDNTYATANYAERAVEAADEGNGSVNVTHISQMNALGRVTAECEVTNTQFIGSAAPASCGLDISGTGYLTTYQYDTLGDMLSSTQGGQTRTYGYNALRQLTTESVPELITGGVQGVISYSYDSEGKLYQKTSPKPNQSSPSTTVTATYTYDALHRPTGVSYNDGSTASTTLEYDQSTYWNHTLLNPIGRLTHESRGSTGAAFSYDEMGRVKQNWQCTPSNCSGTPLELDYSYDRAGDMLTSSNGEGVTLTYGYNGATQPTQISSSFVDSTHPATLLSGITYNPPGAVVSDSLNNATITETSAYDKLVRLISTTATKGASTIYSLGNMAYKSDSNLSTANDSANGNWSYAFDQLNRISSAGTFSFDIDAFSNRWHQNPSGAQLSFDTTTNRIAGGNGVTYDAAGNIINDGMHSFTYDAENRITSVDGGNTATYVYSAEGQRVSKSGGGATYEYLFDLGGNAVTEITTAGVWHRGEVWAGRHLATYFNGTTYFSHQDWEGTERVRSDVNGNVYQNCTNGPYGDNYSCSPAAVSSVSYTGLEQDTESGLMHARFRYYNPRLGVWMSLDPAGIAAASTSNPQSWNRYAYVGNDPVNGVDPLGLVTLPCSPWDFGGGCGTGWPPLPPCDWCIIPPILLPPIGGGGGGGGHRPPLQRPSKPLEGERLGIPNNMRLPNPTLLSLLIPSLPQCDFGPCANLGNGFLGGSGAVPGGLPGVDIGLLGFILAGHKVNLVLSTCAVNNVTGVIELNAFYGEPLPGPSVAVQIPVDVPKDPQGRCEELKKGSGINCYIYNQVGSCRNSICPLGYRKLLYQYGQPYAPADNPNPPYLDQVTCTKVKVVTNP